MQIIKKIIFGLDIKNFVFILLKINVSILHACWLPMIGNASDKM